MIQIAVLGYGTVGSGVVEVLETNQELIAKRAGQEINVKYVLDLRDFPGDKIQDKIVHDYDVIVNDPEIQVVVEVMGGIHPAYEFVKAALEAKKSVATSNKALVAKHGAQLLAIAKEKNVNFFFEASVGGGIPIIRPMNTCLTADDVDEISGILNGTTNYILSKMFLEGLDFDTVLKDAQDKGYAERNPEADVEGYDACRKIAILTSLTTGQQVNFEEIYTEGITKITAEDMKYVHKMGKAVKLIATSRKEDGKIYAMVAPFLLDADHPLYSVNNVFNAIFVHGNMLGDAMFYGSGAGKLPTASAVVADVVDAVRQQDHVAVEWNETPLVLADLKGAQRRFFVRVKGGLAEAETIFGSIEKWEQVVEGESGFITPMLSEKEFEEKAEKLSGMIHRIRLI
ncbi:MAG: homoserine dehydrogenase [Lachnospiraceae bacterium]|nr:homoserine dehydrogenase [Lachnospiraceae bacterium]